MDSRLNATLRPGVVYALEARTGAGGAKDATGGRPGAGVARAWASLASEERVRADRMKDAGARRRFVTGRAFLRAALARLTGTAARDLRLGYGAHGKPFLPGGPSFSLSHSGERMLIAVATRGRVGADVERIRPVRRLDALAARWLAPSEQAWLAAVRESEREAAFFDVWTRKEAFAKALGRGLATPLRSFSVEVGAGPGAPGHDGGLAALAVAGEHADGWTVAGLAAAPGTAAAVAADWRGTKVERLPLGDDGWLRDLGLRTGGRLLPPAANPFGACA